MDSDTLSVETGPPFQLEVSIDRICSPLINVGYAKAFQVAGNVQKNKKPMMIQ